MAWRKEEWRERRMEGRCMGERRNGGKGRVEGKGRMEESEAWRVKNMEKITKQK